MRREGSVEKEIERLLVVFLAMVGNTYGGHESKRTIMFLKRERERERESSRMAGEVAD